MILLKTDGTLPSATFEALRGPIERVWSERLDLCEAFVYGVGGGPGRGQIVVRLSTPQAVVPILFPAGDCEPERVFVALKGALTRSEL